jgi:hypothetical protein
MTPVAFGETLPVETRLTFFSADKPDRSRGNFRKRPYGTTNHLNFDNSRRQLTRSSVSWSRDFEPPLSPKATQANRQSTQIEVRGS